VPQGVVFGMTPFSILGRVLLAWGVVLAVTGVLGGHGTDVLIATLFIGAGAALCEA